MHFLIEKAIIFFFLCQVLSVCIAQEKIVVPMENKFPQLEYGISGTPSYEDDEGIFITPYTFPGASITWSLIIDNTGYPAYLEPVTKIDFRSGESSWIWSDRSIDLITGEITPKTGCELPYKDDGHDYLILENGHQIVLCEYDTIMDLSELMTYPSASLPTPQPGDTNAVVTLHKVVELDIQGNIVKYWDGGSLFQPTDLPNIFFQNPSAMRLMHANSLDILNDILLLSSRLPNEVTAIHWPTGEVLWRLGGKNNEFEFINDPLEGFLGQHTAEWTSDSTISIFDNGLLRQDPIMRGVEYKINPVDMTATLVWEYAILGTSDSQGSLIKTLQGHYVINWGKTSDHPHPGPEILEVAPSGEVTFSIELGNRITYRAFVGGVIADRPKIVCEGDSIKLIDLGIAIDPSQELIEWNNGLVGLAIPIGSVAEHAQAFIPFLDGYLGSNVILETDCSVMSNNQILFLSEIEVFPNPADEFVLIRSVEKPLAFSQLGETLNIFAKKEKEAWKIDLLKIPNGIYFFSADGVMQKVIVQH